MIQEPCTAFVALQPSMFWDSIDKRKGESRVLLEIPTSSLLESPTKADGQVSQHDAQSDSRNWNRERGTGEQEDDIAGIE